MNHRVGHSWFEISEVVPISVRSVDIFVYRAPIETPVVTSFGVMRDRPAVIIRVEDRDGAYGWGEVWCNFPGCGAEHRGRLLETVIAPQLIGRQFDHPSEVFEYLSKSTAILAIQSGEQGPISQTIAAVDIAVWDLIARRAGLPLNRFLGGKKVEKVPVYASGINLAGAEIAVESSRAAGFDAFKVKVGINKSQDLATIRNIFLDLRTNEKLMIDANQAWSLDEAAEMVQEFSDIPLEWLEEPLRADRSVADWQKLKACSKVPLAAGENISGSIDFDLAINGGALTVIQPDLCKWGGISQCLPVAQKAIAANLRYCPHYLGSGIGLLASAHLLAAVGGDGMLEVDSNPNPLRELLAQPYPRISHGVMTLSQEPGLGVDPNLAACVKYLTYKKSCL